MRDYTSYFISLCCLVLGLICATGTIITSLYPASLETNVILYEHRQLYDDWTSRPFVDIRLENANAGCPGDYEPIFYRVWNGTYDLCLGPSSLNLQIKVLQEGHSESEC